VTAGVYVVQFPDHVKIGQSRDLEARIRGHERAGGTCFRVLDADPPANLFIEAIALAAASISGRRRGAREEFDDLTFEGAVEIVEKAAEQYYDQGPTGESPIRQAAKASGRSQTEIATEVGLTYPQWQRRLRGETAWRAYEVADVARVLGVPIEQLVMELPSNEKRERAIMLARRSELSAIASELGVSVDELTGTR
jgi:hypothetical protein